MTAIDAITRLNAALEGRYRVERELGAGGMATVYLAHDLRHEREVALKVLKPELAAVVGAERFLAEIKTTANLQHPHILPLFDSGEVAGFLFYVMPRVEGESLRERLDREHQLPVGEAVRIAADVAEALGYAHNQGVIHRDIKPANILMHAGRPLVSDFGIALAVGAGGGNRLTETGLSIGTPFYMSPEQATGDQMVGPSTDVYALGCVLYEMLVGEPPYTGSTPQAILGKIIQAEPVSATAVRRSVPANVDATVRKALEKIPADRFLGAHDFARALVDPGFGHGEILGTRASGGVTRLWNPLSAGLAAATMILAGLVLWPATRPEPSDPVMRFSLRLEDNQVPNEWLTLSADGSTMVMSHRDDDGVSRLWLRRWGDLRASAIPGMDGGLAEEITDPVMSPDGLEVAFFEDDVLKVIPTDGGLVRTLSEGSCCARWEDDGYIYFRSMEGHIQRTTALGGDAEDVTRLAEGEATHSYFHLLPGGETGLFSVDLASPRIDAIHLSTGERTPIATGTRSYFTSSGHLVFATLDGRLMAAPFDPKSLGISAPVPVIEGIHSRLTDPSYSLSAEGTLAYWRWDAQRSGAEFVSVSLDGSVTPVAVGLVFDPGVNNEGWALSPDGSRMAYRDASGEDDGEIWIVELASGQTDRLTFDPGADWAPQWSTDGSRVYFLSTRGTTDDRRQLWSKPADGTGDARLEIETRRNMAEFVLSPDEQWVVFRAGGPPSQDVLIARLGEPGPEEPLLASPDFNEVAPAISPDGRWLAYVSNETGVQQVYVRPFPDVASGRWQITTSPNFSVAPRWSHDGAKLFYWDGGLTSAVVNTSEGFSLGTPEVHFPLFHTPGLMGSTYISQFYHIGLDGEHILMARDRGTAAEGGEPELILVQNFFEELQRRVPTR